MPGGFLPPMKPSKYLQSAACALVAVHTFLMSNSVIAATTPERSTIEESAKWDLSPMYAGESDWEKHYKGIDKLIEDFAGKKGQARTSPKTLLETLKLRDQINVQLEKLYAYASMRHDEDLRQPGPQ